MKQFKQAERVYAKKYLDEMNISLFFVSEIEALPAPKLLITGQDAYQVFFNGLLILSGPARAAHNYYRIDEIDLPPYESGRLVILLAGYQCNSYQYLNQPPFLQAEVINENKVIFATGINSKAYLYTSRYQKVTRFSYQRAFSESYVFDVPFQEVLLGNAMPYLPVELVKVTSPASYLSRSVLLPTLNEFNSEHIESGVTKFDTTKKPYRDRYMSSEHLLIFPMSEWEVNPNDIISSLSYELKPLTTDYLTANTFMTYKFNGAKTGFIKLQLEVLQSAEVFVTFDEIDMSNQTNSDLVEIDFKRNTTHNIISYKLGVGHHELISFEPYTVHYLRIIVLSGNVKVKNIALKDFSHPLTNSLEIVVTNKKLQAIVDAGRATFSQNSLDILMDCPSRERAGWLCDSYFSGQAEKIITGHNLVEENFLENYALAPQLETLPRGMIPMCYPGEHPDGVYIPNWSLFYILELAAYKKRYGDDALIEKSLPKVKNLLQYFEQFENDLGLLENLENWVFVEWSMANDPAFLAGVNFPTNMLYFATLKAASELLNETKLIEKANHIKKQIIAYGYNKKRHLFVDNMVKNANNEYEITNNITETCQYYAFYFGVATPNEFKELNEIIKKDFGPNRLLKGKYEDVYSSNAFIGNYLRLAILNREELHQQVLDEVTQYFYPMSIKSGTLWEHDSPHASLNHGFASYIINIVIESLSGLKEIDYYNKKIYVNKKKPELDFVFKIPLGENCLSIISANGKITYKQPQNYQLFINEKEND